MEEQCYEASAPDVEILPPERESSPREGGCACLCCGQTRSVLDEDGCGICDECLVP